MASIIDVFKDKVESDPNKLLYAFLDIHGKVNQSYTYLEFLNRTTDIAWHLHRTHSPKPGERILLVYPPGLEMICAFFACVRLGLIPVPIYPPTEHGFQSALYKMTFIAKDCGATLVLTDRSYYWSMKLNLARTKISTFSFKSAWVSQLKWIVSSDAGTNEAIAFPEAHSDILFLQYTSGSTSDPKGVMVTHDNVIHNSNQVVDHTPVGISWLPQYHDMGLIGYYLFFALKGGTTFGFSPLDFIQRPALWLESISKFKGTASSAPNFAYAYCLKPGKIPESTFDKLDLSSLQFFMTAAEPVRTETYLQFLKKFEPYGLNPKSFFSAYGLAEFTLAVSNYGRTISTFATASLQAHVVKPAYPGEVTPVTTLLSCGKPLGKTEIKIVDVSETPRALDPGKVGEIWIRGDCKCSGYWNRPELSKQVFEAKGEGMLQSGSWLRTGDLGFLHDGELYICGRSKDLIIVRGLNYYPQDIENIAEEDSAVRKGCVAAFSLKENGQEVLVVVAELKNPKVVPDSHQINKKLLQFVGIGAQTIVYIQPRTIPKTSSGKIMRHKVRSLFQEQNLKVVHQCQLMNSTKDYDHNNESSLNTTIGKDDLPDLFEKYALNTRNDHETLADIGLDSMKLAEFTQEIKSYLEQKGFEDLSRHVAINLIQRITIYELNEILHGLGTSTIHSKLRFKQALQRLQRDHQELEQALMKSDVKSATISTRSAVKHINHLSSGNILLTGGTGFFGPFLLKSLLEQTTDDICVLVRANDSDIGMNRLREAFSKTGFGETLQQAFESRVRPVCGNLGRPLLGLSQSQWNTLAMGTHTLYHNGAQVNYLFDYEAMRQSNVQGTHEIIKLANQGRPKVINHISTTFIFGWSVKETLREHDANQEMHALDFGYSQSKWVSEHIIMHAMRAGMNARIFRPALISPSVAGDGYNFDISIRLLAFMLKHGISTRALNQVSFVPADVAANNIVAISNINESLGKTFHVTRDEYSTMKDITDLLGNLTGVNFQLYSLQDFVPEVVSRCTKTDILFPLLNFLERSVDNIQAMEFKRYDNSFYKTYRDQSPWGMADPKLNDVVSGILRFMERHGIAEPSMVKSHV